MEKHDKTEQLLSPRSVAQEMRKRTTLHRNRNVSEFEIRQERRQFMVNQQQFAFYDAIPSVTETEDTVDLKSEPIFLEEKQETTTNEGSDQTTSQSQSQTQTQSQPQSQSEISSASSNEQHRKVEISSNKNATPTPMTPKKVKKSRKKNKRMSKLSKNERIITYQGTGACTVKPDARYPVNKVNNQKYSIFTLLPLFLWAQFSQFGNLYFLVTAILQLIPELQVTYWWTNWGPLFMVLLISFLREVYDDFLRWKRDREVNHEKYQRIEIDADYGFAIKNTISASEITVGDLIILHENERVPCDMVLLYCSTENGSTFIRTDQLDGETDWKLRKPVATIQEQFKDCQQHAQLASLQGILKVEAPHPAVYEFLGTFTTNDGTEEPLNLENTMWASTIVATGTVVGCAVYTGIETRSQLNTQEKPLKLGLLDKEINYYAKLLFVILLLLAGVLSGAKGVTVQNVFRVGLYGVRFILLLSYIIPLSLRVYLDFAKMYFSMIKIERDQEIPGTTARCTTIPEELGRIEYLFSDKTGTLTQNEMVFKKLQLKPPLLYEPENLNLLKKMVRDNFVQNSTARVSTMNSEDENEVSKSTSSPLLSALSNVSILSRNSTTASRRSSRLLSANEQANDIIEALALCHNVTPIINEVTNVIDYQASSPDEVALVKFTESIGVTLIHRSNEDMTLQVNCNSENDKNKIKKLNYQILRVFPFTSASKRMGIIVKNLQTDEIIFFVKGSDSIMKNIVETSEWLDEETENLGREGLRTLVFAKKVLTLQQFQEFESQYHAASCSMQNRKLQMESIRERLEHAMTLLGITGVEDKLQINVQQTLETLRNANIKIWMLTGDKVETAIVIARSSRLVGYNQNIYQLIAKNEREALLKLDKYGNQSIQNTALVLDGPTLTILLNYYKNQFIECAVEAPVVICCRCSPTQKAIMVQLVQEYTQKVCAAIGDGGNDVSMILAANVGIGIVGQEGKCASMASDFSINQFEYLSRLLLWHGRIAYKQTAKMAQFVIHRGLIIALLQSMFSASLYYSAIPLFPGLLAVGYVCFYTNFPVGSFIMDHDITAKQALFYPELYHPLQKGHSLNNATFLNWILKSFYQAGVIMVLTFYFFETSFHNVISISFTALIVTEMVNIIMEIKHWNIFMVISTVVSLGFYALSVWQFTQYFDHKFILSLDFIQAVGWTTTFALLPVLFAKFAHAKMSPSSHAKLKEEV